MDSPGRSSRENEISDLNDPMEEIDPVELSLVCGHCELKLDPEDKYCPECGKTTDLGIAMDAIRKLGDTEEPENPWGVVSPDTAPSISPKYGGVPPWSPYVSTTGTTNNDSVTTKKWSNTGGKP